MTQSHPPLFVDIPLVAGAEEAASFVRINVDNPPHDVEDILNALRAEAAPLSYWLDIAKSYLARGDEHTFDSILQEASSDEVINHFITQQGGQHDALLVRCTLAARLVERASQLSEEGGSAERVLQRADMLTEAGTLLTRIRQDASSRTDQLPYIVAGQLALCKGDVAGAQEEFRKGMHYKIHGQHNNSCRLLLASLYYEQKNFKKALTLYCQALRSQPNCPPEVRLGIAACQWQLGNVAQARAAYQRILALSPTNVDALLGLALLDINRGDVESVSQGLHLLQEAYRANAEHPIVCLVLARYFLLKNRPDKAKDLAQKAHDTCDIPTIRAAADTTLGRALHAQGHLSEALKCYVTAARLQPNNLLPRFGQSQVIVLRRDYNNVASLLLQLLKEAPGWIDALRLLWALSSKVSPAILGGTLEHFKVACKKDPQDPQLREMFGDLQTMTNPAEALRCYEEAIALHCAQGGGGVENGVGGENGGHGGLDGVPPRLLNNTAVLVLQTGDAQRAQRFMNTALELQAKAVEEAAQAGTTDAHAALLQMTLAFNNARVLEACGEWETAERLYEQASDSYSDCYLRLALLAKRRGEYERALEWVGKAEKIVDLQADAMCIKACVYVDMGHPDKASELFKKVEGSKQLAAAGGAPRGGAVGGADAYARISLANLHLHHTSVERFVRKADGSKMVNKDEVNRLQRAYQRFVDVLTKEPGNAFAAHGLGCILAEGGFMEAAKTVFIMVQEATAASYGFVQIPEAYINLGHVYLALHQPINAIRMYELALTKSNHDRRPAILSYLARAHYEARDVDISHVLRAKDVLQRVLHLQPNNLEAIFDIAFCSQAYCGRVVKNATPVTEEGRVSEINMAQRELVAALRTFRHLKSLSKALGWDTDRVGKHVDYIQQHALKDTEIKRKAVEDAWLKYSKAQQLKEAEIRAAEQQRELERVRVLAQQRAIAEAQEQQAREMEARQRMVREKHKQERALVVSMEGGKGKKRKGKGGKDDDDGFLDDTLLLMGGGTNAGRGGPSTAALEAAGLVSTSEDDDDYNPDAPGEADHEGSPAPSSPGHSGGGGVGRGAAGEVGSGGAAEGGGKRRRLSGVQDTTTTAAAHDDLDDLEDDDVQDMDVDDAGGSGVMKEGAGGGGRTRRHMAALFDDEEEDEEEEEGGKDVNEGGEEEEGGGRGKEQGEEDKQGDAGEEEDVGGDVAVNGGGGGEADLFGDEDEEDA